MGKEATYFDAVGFEQHCGKIAKHNAQFAAAVKTLQKEGMDVSAKYLRTWPERFGDFAENDGSEYKKHFVALYKQAENRAGWLPMEERTRMFDSYIAVFNRTLSAAAYIVGALNFGCIITDTDEGASVDVKATENEHRKKFVVPIHADKIAEHWDLLIAAKQAISKLKEWEATNGMAQTGSPGDFYSFGLFVNGTPLRDGTQCHITREAHDKAVWQYFKI